MLRLLLIAIAIFGILFLNAQSPCAIEISPDTLVVCKGQSVVLPAMGTPSKLTWIPSTGLNNNKVLNPVASPQTTITYIVENIKYNGVELITNGDFEQGNSGFTSQYLANCSAKASWFPNDPVLDEKNYCITDSAGKFTGFAGWKNCKNITPGGSKIMVVNGATTKDESVWCQQINNIQPNSDYEFSTWVSTIFESNPALLQFTINNVKLDQPFQADIKGAKWTQFYTVWNSGFNTSANICITNQNTLSNGNDFALDDISFKPVCKSRDTLVVQVVDNLQPNLGSDTSICPGDTLLLKSRVSAQFEHKWNDILGTNSIKITQPGFYKVSVNNNGCEGADSITVGTVGIPYFDLGKDTTYCFPLLQYVILGSSMTAKSYLWNSGSSDRFYKAYSPGKYWLTLSNGKNCTYTDTIDITGACDATTFYLPNAFTPNNDGINEKYVAVGENILKFKMMIFNRWGELLFESDDIASGWDGTYDNLPAPLGLYVALCIYEDIDSKTQMKRENKVYSTVCLMR